MLIRVLPRTSTPRHCPDRAPTQNDPHPRHSRFLFSFFYESWSSISKLLILLQLLKSKKDYFDSRLDIRLLRTPKSSSSVLL